MPLRRRREVTHAGQDVDSDHQIVRLLRCVSGSVDVQVELCPTFDFARSEAKADRKSTRLNSSHPSISYAVFCLKKKNEHVLGRRLERFAGPVLLLQPRLG